MGKKFLIFLSLAVSLFAAGQPSLVEVTKLVKGEVNPLQEFIGTVKFDKSSVLARITSYNVCYTKLLRIKRFRVCKM